MSVGQAVLRFRVGLRDIAPPIWREIEVPSNYSFWDFTVLRLVPETRGKSLEALATELSGSAGGGAERVTG